MIKNILFVLALIQVTVGVSQENVFLNRDFWKAKPTVALVDEKIKEGNDPAQANGNNFDGVVMAILADAPYETITHLISQKGNDVNKLTHDGRTYVFWAAYNGNTELMQFLIDRGARMDMTDDHGLTPLNFAAGRGQMNTKVYDICLANGANLQKDVNNNGANALLLAAPNDQDFKLMTYFKSKGLDVNSVDREGNGVFNYVARTGNLELLNQLLEKGIKGNDQAFLFTAAGARGSANGVEVYKFLEDKGLNPNVTNDEGQTPLHIVAARSKDKEVINYLLEKGLSVNQEDHNGNTPFMNACLRNDLEVVQLLGEDVKQINHANKKGETALYLAIAGNKSNVVGYLINKGAEIGVTTAEGNNLVFALLESYNARNKEAFESKLKLLSENGLDLEQEQGNGDTWYHLAVKKGSSELLDMAAKMNLDINAKNKEGNTALHLAAMKAKDDQIMKWLLNHGANKKITTEFEETAHDLAQENELLEKNQVSIEFLK